MKLFFAMILCILMMLFLCSCTEIYVEILYDRPPVQEAVVTLPPETRAQNVDTGDVTCTTVDTLP